MTAKFWVGGTGTWDNSTTTNWSLSTGGAGGAAVPGSADTVTFDGASGGGTVTLAAALNGLSFQSINMSTFTGTLDFSVNNPSITLTGAGFTVSGSATRTLKLGSGTLTLSPAGGNNTGWSAGTTTGLTFNAGTSTIVYNGTTSVTINAFAGGGLTYNNVIFATTSPLIPFEIIGNNTFALLSLTPPLAINFASGSTQTFTTAFAFVGTAFNNAILFQTLPATNVTLSCATGTCTFAWCALTGITGAGGATFTATNSFDLKANSNITITGPSGGGAGVGAMIGGL